MGALLLLVLIGGGLAAAVAAGRKDQTLTGKRATGPIKAHAVAGVELDVARDTTPIRMAKAVEDKPTLKTWGDSPADRATWHPAYLKSLGTKDLRWGVCLPDLIEEIQADPRVPEWTKQIDDVVVAVANVVAAGSGAVAEWLLDRACIRFKWPLLAYESESGERLWAVYRYEPHITYTLAPPHPFPKRTGWKRVWVRGYEGGFAAGTRNETAVEVYWPREESGGPAVSELVSTSQIRAMLRLSADVTGAISAKQLAGTSTGKSKFWFARRDKAMGEFR
jgi:hypothetical protein